MKKLLPILIPVFCAILVLVLFSFVFYLGYVPTASMEPTIPQGSLVLGVRRFGDLHPGDIVIFRHEGRILVKRIAAGPGETYILNGRPVTIPAGYYLLLGDNAEDSFDARYWEDPFIVSSDIIAKCF